MLVIVPSVQLSYETGLEADTVVCDLGDQVA